MRSLPLLLFLLPALSPAAVRFSDNRQSLQVPNQHLIDLGIAHPKPYNDGINGDMFTSTDFTVEAWVKPSEDARNQSFKFILSKNRGGTGYALVMIGKNHDQRFHFEADSLASYGFQNGYNERAFRNKWFHIAGVRKGNKLFIFINGMFASEADKPGPVRPNDLPLWIGSSPFDNSSFRGDIADLRLWRTARTHAEIVHFMNRKLSGTEDMLAGYYPLEKDFENKTTRDYNGSSHRNKERDAKPFGQAPQFVAGPQLGPSLEDVAARSPKINIEIDGKPVEFSSGAEPFVMNGRAYAAVCTVSNAIGLTMGRANLDRHYIVVYAPPLTGPTKDDPTKLHGIIPVGALTCTFDGNTHDLPDAAIVIDRSTPLHSQSETYYPLTFVTGLLGHKVKWIESIQTVQIITKKQ